MSKVKIVGKAVEKGPLINMTHQPEATQMLREVADAYGLPSRAAVVMFLLTKELKELALEQRKASRGA